MNEPIRLVSEAPSDTVAVDRMTAFEDLVEAEHGNLCGALCLITRDRPEAEDVMQEAFLPGWERWDRVARIDDPLPVPHRDEPVAEAAAARLACRWGRPPVARFDYVTRN